MYFRCKRRINDIRLSNDEDISSFELADIGEDNLLFSSKLFNIISDVILIFLFFEIVVKSEISATLSTKLFLNSSSLNSLFNFFKCSSYAWSIFSFKLTNNAFSDWNTSIFSFSLFSLFSFSSFLSLFSSLASSIF